MNTAAKEESTSGLLAVLLETRVRGSAPKNTTDISPEPSVSSTLRWDSWQAYDRTAVERLVGLDYFGARYFSGAQGRFTSPDAPFADQLPEDPQSWNLYSYVRNNPLRAIDPTGRCSEAAGGGYTDEGSGLFPGKCSEGQIGGTKPQQVTVGVGQEEANLIMLQMVGERLSSPHQWADLTSKAGQDAAALWGLKSLVEGGWSAVKAIWEVKDAARLANLMNILRQAGKFKGNFGLGSATAEEAEALGKAWVGDGATVASDGKTLVSADGLKQYRPPSFKPNLGKTQANFESRWTPGGQWQTNGHLDIK